ncbi:MAG: DUF262 domain-containing protein [Chloroflexi bacterium]|nr:DUF262 domain-containing protein [Chloroflexota bacterium]
MDGMTTFTSDKEPLQEILKDAAVGEIQLPEFQRPWVWDDAHICSLLASVSLSYPIGAVMMLENGNPEVRFKPRPVKGIELQREIEPERFILDGQQRLTALFQALFLRRAVTTRDARKREIKRWYCIDMCKALDANWDREDAIISLPEDKRIRNFRNEILEDYSTPDAEYQHDLFPLNCVFDCADWRTAYNMYWNYASEKTKLFDQFDRNVIKRFEQYMVPVIKLLKNTPKVAVCQVFEKVNTGGVSLTVFELVTATFAADGYNLREDWEGKLDNRGQKVAEGRKDVLIRQRVLRSVGADELLQAVTLLATYERKHTDTEAPVSCKRNDILKLSLGEYKKWVNPATSGFLKAGKLLFQQKLFSNRDVPYGTQVVPLSGILTLLGDRADNDTIREKLIRWFWCGVFGELYGSTVETRFARDVLDVLTWIAGGEDPKTVGDCNFAPARLYTLRTRNSAAYKGLYALLMRDRCLDFRTGEPVEIGTYFEDSIDIHHIFPRGWCRRQGVEARYYDSIVNKTALSYRTNRIISGNAPSVYLRILRERTGMSEDRQDDILASHVIDADALKRDDFWGFFEARKEALLVRIEKATGKAIGREIQEDQDTGTQEPDDDEEIHEDDQLLDLHRMP